MSSSRAKLSEDVQVANEIDYEAREMLGLSARQVTQSRADVQACFLLRSLISPKMETGGLLHGRYRVGLCKE